MNIVHKVYCTNYSSFPEFGLVFQMNCRLRAEHQTGESIRGLTATSNARSYFTLEKHKLEESIICQPGTLNESEWLNLSRVPSRSKYILEVGPVLQMNRSDYTLVEYHPEVSIRGRTCTPNELEWLHLSRAPARRKYSVPVDRKASTGWERIISRY